MAVREALLIPATGTSRIQINTSTNTMHFPKLKGDGRPWINLDGQAGCFKLSTPDGDKTVIDAKGMKFGLDLHNATQGWLALGKGLRDWQPLDDEDDWGEPPTPDHRPGIELDLICPNESFGDEPVRVFNGASLAVTNFVAAVSDAVNGSLNDPDAIPTIRVKDVKQHSIGKGSSVTVDFDVAPLDKWMRRADVMPGTSSPSTASETAEAETDNDDDWSD